MQLIVANFVVFMILAPFLTVHGFGSFPLAPYTIVNDYGVFFEIWASASLAIDTAIAGIMIWSVRETQ